MNKSENQKLDILIQDVAEVKQALKGYNGQIGLCKQVGNNSKQITKLWIMIVAILVSLGGGVWGVVQIVMGGM